MNSLKILQENGIKVPKFLYFSDENILDFSEIKFKLRYPFILRSSFSLEDGINNAFAGIFQSYFPIFDKKTYLNALNKCIFDFDDTKLKNYAKFSGIDISLNKPNFLIQEFINGDFSGICFTNFGGKVFIEIIPGLNEKLVNGEIVDPFQLVVSRDNFYDFEIKNFYLGEDYLVLENDKKIIKKFEIFGFEEKIIDNFLQKMISLFMKIEKIFNYPQDIEFTIKNNEIFILQSRNITI